MPRKKKEEEINLSLWTQEELFAIEEKKRNLVRLEKRAEKLYEEIQTEFYKEVGRINPLRFKTLIEKHCWTLMQLLYETTESNREISRRDNSIKYYE